MKSLRASAQAVGLSQSGFEKGKIMGHHAGQKHNLK
jgi:hypothetical protein